MAVAKEYLFSQEDREIAVLGKALAHAARVQVINLLLKRPASYEEIHEMIPLSETAGNDHLRILERSQLLRRTGLPSGAAGYALNHERYRYLLRVMAGRIKPDARYRRLPEEGRELGGVV